MSFSGRAEHDLGLVGMSALAEEFQELHSAHDGHVPVEQDDIRHFCIAAIERLAAIAGLLDLELQVSRICRATLRITLLSSTMRQVFIVFPCVWTSLLSDKGNEHLKPRALPRPDRQSTQLHRPAAAGLLRFPPFPARHRSQPSPIAARMAAGSDKASTTSSTASTVRA
jgi:hypothetical protein